MNNSNSLNSPVLLTYFVYTVWLITTFYTVLFLYLGATYSSISVGFGTIVFAPFTLWLIRQDRISLARTVFIACCNLYIFCSSLCSGHAINSEYFAVPALFVVLLLTDLEDKKTIAFGLLLPLISWVMASFVQVELPLDKAIFTPSLISVFRSLNFLSSFSLSVTFLMMFVKVIKLQKMKLIASDKMSTLGEMASGIAHEVNNPLTIIIGTVNIIKKRIPKNELSLEVLEKDLLKIESTSMRISKIVKGLQMFSRESNDDPFILSSVESIVNSTLDLSSEKCRKMKIKIQSKIPSAELVINSRASQISQVLLNLINNSIDAIEKLEDRWINIEVSETDLRVLISVTDSGLGIPPSVVKKLMQPFFTTKPVGKGTGLGLSISKGLIEMHHGSLNYISDSKNTKFVIDLPKPNRVENKTA